MPRILQTVLVGFVLLWSGKDNFLTTHVWKTLANLKVTPLKSLVITLFTVDKVTKLFFNLEENKATGPDEISPQLIRLSVLILSQTITRLLNLIIATHTFPSTWKIGRVSLIHKSGNKSKQRLFMYIMLFNQSKILWKHTDYCTQVTIFRSFIFQTFHSY